MKRISLLVADLVDPVVIDKINELVDAVNDLCHFMGAIDKTPEPRKEPVQEKCGECGLPQASNISAHINGCKNNKDELAERLSKIGTDEFTGEIYWSLVEAEARKWAVEVVEEWDKESLNGINKTWSVYKLLLRLRGTK